MKKSELDREVRQACKLEAKQRGWKSVGGMPYWTIGPLFFVMVTSASAKEDSFYCSLRFKWLSLDRELWRVLGMSSNEREPFSLHANGAFVLTGHEVFSASERPIEWSADVLKEKIANAAAHAEHRAREVASQISDLDAYLDFIQREHAAFMQRYPRAVVNVHKEELLAALARGRLHEAKQIAVTRIAAGDSGGFSSNGKSFYENALSLCGAGA
jgi:hypothetical protein